MKKILIILLVLFSTVSFSQTRLDLLSERLIFTQNEEEKSFIQDTRIVIDIGLMTVTITQKNNTSTIFTIKAYEWNKEDKLWQFKITEDQGYSFVILIEKEDG